MLDILCSGSCDGNSLKKNSLQPFKPFENKHERSFFVFCMLLCKCIYCIDLMDTSGSQLKFLCKVEIYCNNLMDTKSL